VFDLRARRVLIKPHVYATPGVRLRESYTSEHLIYNGASTESEES